MRTLGGTEQTAQKSLDSVVDEYAHTYPDLEACRSRVSGQLRIYSYLELQRESIRLAARISTIRKLYASSRPIAVSMRRDFAWYALYIAAIRLRIPIAPLVQDIEITDTQEARNLEILTSLTPFLVVVDSDSPPSLLSECTQAGIGVLFFSELCLYSESAICVPIEPNIPLAYLYTGGTTSASKCVCVSHSMAMSEIYGYPQILSRANNFKFSSSPRILQHSSTYWGATFLGQINIALALGGSVIFATNFDHIDDVNVLGLVPAQLAALPISPKFELVFTWGEKLSKKIAQNWCEKVLLVDLLVSTEYWLSMYSIGGCGVFEVIEGCTVEIDPDSQCLVISGPSVTPFGYTDSALNAEFFSKKNRMQTNDRVEIVGRQQIRFLGRADSIMKIGGEWVDLDVLGEEIGKIPGVKNACIRNSTAFIQLSNQAFTETTLYEIRNLVNEQYIKIEFVCEILRNPITLKIDGKKMQKISLEKTPDCRPFITGLKWILTQLVVVSIIYCFASGVVGILSYPFYSLYVLEQQKFRVPYWLHANLSFPIVFLLIFPVWVSFSLVLPLMYRGGFSWWVSFYLGLPRQIELILSWPSFASPSGVFSDKKLYRGEKIWEPFGPRSQFREELMATWTDFSTVSLCEEEVARIGQSDWAKSSQKMEENESNGLIAKILKRVSNSTQLTRINSLAAVEVVALLREEGYSLSVRDVLQSRTIADLEKKISQNPAKNSCLVEEFRCQLWGWGFPCTWLFEIVEPRDRNVHMRVLTALMQRHSAFQVELVDSLAKSRWMNEVLVVVGLLKFFSPSLSAWIGKYVFESFTRVRINKDAKPWLKWYETELNSLGQLRSHFLWKKRQFYLPFEAEIIRVGSRQFLRLFVTHAFSDGASVVPILNDLNKLYLRNGVKKNWLDSNVSTDCDGDSADTMEIRNDCGLGLQEARLKHSLSSRIVAPTDLYLSYNMDMDAGGPSVGKMVFLDESFVAVATRAAQRLACSIDILFLSAIALTLADEAKSHSIDLALIVPLRDSESDMVGFLADQRNLSIPVHPTNSCLLSVVNTVQRMCRNREWQIPDPFTNCKRPLVNIVQANFPTKHQVRQELYLQQYEAPSGVLYRPVEIYLEQIDVHAWMLKIRERDKKFDIDIFRQTVIDLLSNPCRNIDDNPSFR